MRAIFAGVFVFVGLMIIVALIGDLRDKASPVRLVLISVGIAAAFLLLVLLALFLFNAGQKRETDTALTNEEWIKDLEAQGLLVSTDFRATRALQVVGPGDDDAYLFIELESGEILFFTGPYLDEYLSPIDDLDAAGNPEAAKPIYFPCTDFTIRRHKNEGFVVDILCRGQALEVEYVEPADKYSGAFDLRLDDGSIVKDRTFDEIRALRGTRIEQ